MHLYAHLHAHLLSPAMAHDAALIKAAEAAPPQVARRAWHPAVCVALKFTFFLLLARPRVRRQRPVESAPARSRPRARRTPTPWQPDCGGGGPLPAAGALPSDRRPGARPRVACRHAGRPGRTRQHLHVGHVQRDGVVELVPRRGRPWREPQLVADEPRHRNGAHVPWGVRLQQRSVAMGHTEHCLRCLHVRSREVIQREHWRVGHGAAGEHAISVRCSLLFLGDGRWGGGEAGARPLRSRPFLESFFLFFF